MKISANMAHMQYLLRWYHDTAILQVWQIKMKCWLTCHIYKPILDEFVNMISESSSTNYVLNTEKFGQYDPYAILS